ENEVRLLHLLVFLRILAGTMTPRQARLSGVISCSRLKDGTAVGGELLHRLLHNIICFSRYCGVKILDDYLITFCYAFVRNIHWFPDVRVNFTLQAIVVGYLRLTISNRL